MSRQVLAVLFLCGGWIVATAKADLFEWHEIPGSGAGFDSIATSSFAYLSMHEAIQSADINGDGAPDVVVLADGSDSGVPSKNVSWGESPPLGVSGYVGSDLAWFENDQAGSFIPHLITPLVSGVESPAVIYNGKTLEVMDLDQDDDMDIVVWTNAAHNQANEYAAGAARVAWFENRRNASETFSDGGPRFVQHDILSNSGPGQTFLVDGVTYEKTYPRGGAVADMDGDGWPDIVVLNHTGAASGRAGLYWFKNNGASASTNQSLRFTQTPGNVVPVDVLGAGGGSGPYYMEASGIVVVASDVDNDGKMDLVVGENGGTSADRELTFLQRQGNSSQGHFKKILLRSDFWVSQSIAVEDLFGSACQEIVAGGPGSVSALSIFQATDSNCRTWNSGTMLPDADGNNHIWDVRVADFNSDGRSDILAFAINDDVHQPGTAFSAALLPDRYAAVTLWVNSGADPSNWNSFPLVEKSPLPGMAIENGGGLAVADFDGDGDNDVVRAHIETNLAYFENTWNTERHVAITATAVRNGIKQKVTSFLSTSPTGRLVNEKAIGQKVENQ